MKRFLICASVALAAAATARAATFSDAVKGASTGGCTATSDGGAIKAAAGWACAKGQVAAASGGVSGKLTFKVSVPAGYEHGSSNLKFIVMNNNRKSSWALSAKVYGPENDRSAGTGPINSQGGNKNFNAFGSGAWTKSDGSETATVGYDYTWSQPCAGEYLVSFANAQNFAADLEFYYALNSESTTWMAPAVSNGKKVSIRGQLLLGKVNSVQVPISDAWSMQGYIVQDVTMTVADTAHTVQKGTWGLSIVATQQGSTSGSAVNNWGTGKARSDTSPWAWDGTFDKPAGGQDVTLAWHGVSPRSICSGVCDSQTNFDKYGKAWVSVTWPTLTDSNAGGYDWSGWKYFVELDVSITVVEYPDITGKSLASQKILASSMANKNKAIPVDWLIYTMTPPDNLWSQASVSFSGVQDNAKNADLEPSVTGPVDNSALSVSWGNAWEFLTYSSTPQSTKWKGGANMYNKDMWTSEGSLNSMGSNRYLAPYTRSYTPKLIVKVSRGSCNGVDLTFSVAGSAFSSAKGECASYQDCFAPTGDHPTSSDRLDESANSDSSRFVHCIVGTDWSGGAGNGKPSTMCTECMSDCDCNPGQYCMVDDGTCSNGQLSGSPATWLCDAPAGAKWGTCQNKNKDVIGSRCRPNSALASDTASLQLEGDATVGTQTWRSSGTSLTSTPSKFPLVAGTGDPLSEDFDVSDRGNTGFGFCGEARYYNASNPDASYMSLRARTTLWTGACINFVCVECTNTPCTGWQCLNNQLVSAISVDFTGRTYTKNVIAGTLLGATFMVILLQLCTVANVMYTKKIADATTAPTYQKNPATA